MNKDRVWDVITLWLHQSGYKTGIFGDWLHSNGLPKGLCVRPDYAIMNGTHAIIVTPTMVYQCYCLNPVPENTWKIHKAWTYTDHGALKRLLDSLVTLPTGCWNVHKEIPKPLEYDEYGLAKT
jgi:hypothetical protein